MIYIILWLYIWGAVITFGVCQHGGAERFGSAVIAILWPIFVPWSQFKIWLNHD